MAACGFSPETHYYSLTPVESGQPANLSSGSLLQVSHVTIPAMLDRESLVRREGAGELKISGTSRWAAPLAEMIQNVLAEDLRRKLPDLVILPGDPVPQGEKRSIAVNVRHFAADNSKRVVLLADWSLLSEPPAEPILTRSEAISLPISSSSSSEVVSVMSEALAILGDRIAETISAQNFANERVIHPSQH
jgi:uncharacterized protein